MFPCKEDFLNISFVNWWFIIYYEIMKCSRVSKHHAKTLCSSFAINVSFAKCFIPWKTEPTLMNKVEVDPYTFFCKKRKWEVIWWRLLRGSNKIICAHKETSPFSDRPQLVCTYFYNLVFVFFIFMGPFNGELVPIWKELIAELSAFHKIFEVCLFIHWPRKALFMESYFHE